MDRFDVKHVATDVDGCVVRKAAQLLLARCFSGTGKFLPIALEQRIALPWTIHWANVLLFGPGQYLYLLMNG